jgi:DHA3 family macrolide efflux protein-like MFS transporter
LWVLKQTGLVTDFALAAVVMLFVTIPCHKAGLDESQASPSFLSEVKAGWLYIKQRPSLIYLLGYFSVVNLVAGIVMVSVSVLRMIIMVAVGLFLINFSLPIIASSSRVIWQSKVESAIQGRVFAIRRMAGQIIVPLGSLIVGPLVDHYLDPMMRSGNDMALFITSIVGSGEGRSLGLMLVLFACLPILLSLWAYRIKPLVHIERILPDILPDR